MLALQIHTLWKCSGDTFLVPWSIWTSKLQKYDLKNNMVTYALWVLICLQFNSSDRGLCRPFWNWWRDVLLQWITLRYTGYILQWVYCTLMYTQFTVSVLYMNVHSEVGGTSTLAASKRSVNGSQPQRWTCPPHWRSTNLQIGGRGQ